MTCVKIKMNKKISPFHFGLAMHVSLINSQQSRVRKGYFYLSLLVFHFSLLTNLINDFFYNPFVL